MKIGSGSWLSLKSHLHLDTKYLDTTYTLQETYLFKFYISSNGLFFFHRETMPLKTSHDMGVGAGLCARFINQQSDGQLLSSLSMHTDRILTSAKRQLDVS